MLRAFRSPDAIAVPTWRGLFEAVRDGSADAAVVAIENSLAGSIRETYDLLGEFDLSIIGAVSVPIRLALVALPGETLDGIQRIYSHAQALAQVDDFLRTRPWQVLTTYNTAGAAKMIADTRERHAGAVAAPRVAELYGLQVLAQDIQGARGNRTRFAVIAGHVDAFADAWVHGVRSGEPMTTLVFAVRNTPGSLHRCLGAFASRGVNLSRLESRPSRAARWEYVFWVDVDVASDDPSCAAALDELRAEAAMVRVLGCYPRPIDDD